PYLVTVPKAKTSKLRVGSTDRTGPRLRLLRHRLRGGRMRLTAKASDRAGIARVELRIDGRKVRARRASKLSFTWHLRRGRHRIGVIAYDKRGNRSIYLLSLKVARA
ncbi:MAG: hypothetical protein QOE60_1963, partial [Thermoleophilaceae bacterium]|nr:hypothetical protein [Thermoleophilaceae bacterium]